MSNPAPIEFFAAGEPKGQPRARSFVLRGKNGKPIMTKDGQPIVRAYDPATAEGWKQQIAIAGKDFVPFPALAGPVKVDAFFVFGRPRSHFRTGRLANVLRDDAPEWHTGKPDRDNLDKAVLDALKVLGFFVDDSQACLGTLSKIYGDEPGCTIRIESLAQPKRAMRVQEKQEALPLA